MDESKSIVVAKVTVDNIVNSIPDGLDLQQSENGRVRLSLEAMKSLGDQFGNKPPQPNANNQQRRVENVRSLAPTERSRPPIAF